MIFEVSNPLEPKLLFSEQMKIEKTVAILPDGKYMFAVDSSLKLYDISNPNSPNFVSKIDTENKAIFSKNRI